MMGRARVRARRYKMSLDTKLECEVGVCGRCNTGYRQVCTGCPVLRMDETKRMDETNGMM